ncbi:hypothetical protein B7R21_16840 [Subtercola boreus]|uniref:Peptidoglycan binding-like domain-containing protein n=1 Tax=Subtercola boreus TaxID=120213 RepID=A0A3E0VC56_9MICO|nr:peptidoglycan-binding protein [Subtercola boreus]RFA07123.1 hypothetical protein B7R21_16840 [Subtercola boreus]
MSTTDEPDSTETDTAERHQQSPRRRGRRGIGVAIFTLLVAAVAVGGLWILTGAGNNAAVGAADKTPSATEAVQQGDLAGSTTVTGTLRYADRRSIQSATGGTITALPAEGAVISLGGRLYSVNNIPIFLLRGGLPAWRSFESGMDNGPDVKQLEESLRDLGHFSDEPDERFTWATVEAVKAWQDANGLDDTGTLPLGSFVFSSSDLRIGTVTVKVGDLVGAGTGLFDASSTTQIIETNIPLAEQQLAVIGAAVNVHLPGGATTTGVIESVGTPTEVDGATGQKQTMIPAVVALTDATATAAFQEAAVSVDVPSERRENVLSVPVGAILALTEDEFGVEVEYPDGTTTQVPVTLGLFAGGRVEVFGDGIEAGTLVVVPRR